MSLSRREKRGCRRALPQYKGPHLRRVLHQRNYSDPAAEIKRDGCFRAGVGRDTNALKEALESPSREAFYYYFSL
jgi:hypothetical protein